jgi:hypothetical protein
MLGDEADPEALLECVGLRMEEILIVIGLPDCWQAF